MSDTELRGRAADGAWNAGVKIRHITRKTLERWALAAIFGASGVVHLAAPEVYRPIMPPWLPAPLQLIYASGVCELLGALGLLAPGVPLVRRAARYGLVALLFAVFPANVQMAVNGFTQGAPPLVLALEVARLPLQWALIMLVLDATNDASPGRGRERPAYNIAAVNDRRTISR